MHPLTLYKSPYPKLRLGDAHDGGYVLVDLPGDYDHFLSAGAGFSIAFEHGVLDTYPQLHGQLFDGTMATVPALHARLQFHGQNLGSAQTPGATNWCTEVQPFTNLLVKIDIEGHEYRVLPELIAAGHMPRIKQLVLEVHTPADLNKRPGYYGRFDNITQAVMFNLLADINKTHVLVHLHANNFADQHLVHVVPCPNVFEATYLRKDLVPRLVRNDTPLPTPLDTPSNPYKPDIALRGYPYNTLDEQDTTAAFKAEVVAAALRGDVPLPTLAMHYRLHPGQIVQWMTEHPRP